MAKYNPKPRVIFAGTASFAVPALAKLLNVADICLVITQPAKPAGRGLKETESPIAIFAEENHLPVFRPTSLKRENIEEILKDYTCDYIIVAAYGKILPQWILNFPKYRALNIHGSLLPQWRGASPIQHALLNGDNQTGVNLMEMTAGMDEGPLLSKLSCDIQKHDTVQTLTEKLGNMGAELLGQFFKNPHIQAVAQEGEATYAPKIEKSRGQIHWEKDPAEFLHRAFRALDPWPGLYSWTENHLRFKIHGLGAIHKRSPAETLWAPGSLKIQDHTLRALCADHWIVLTEIQIEGKNKIQTIEALKDKNHWIYTLHALKSIEVIPNV